MLPKKLLFSNLAGLFGAALLLLNVMGLSTPSPQQVQAQEPAIAGISVTSNGKRYSIRPGSQEGMATLVEIGPAPPPGNILGPNDTAFWIEREPIIWNDYGEPAEPQVWRIVQGKRDGSSNRQVLLTSASFYAAQPPALRSNSAPNELTLSLDGKSLYFDPCLRGIKFVHCDGYKLDLQSKQISRLSFDGWGSISIAPDGLRSFFTVPDNCMGGGRFFHTYLSTPTGRITLGTGMPGDIFWLSDGRLLFSMIDDWTCDNRAETNRIRLSASNGVKIRDPVLDTKAFEVIASPDELYVAYIKGRYDASFNLIGKELWIVKMDGSGLHKITDLPLDTTDLHWEEIAPTADLELTGFIVDSYVERGQCYDVLVVLRNNTAVPITRNISLSEQATYLNNEGQPAPLLAGRTDRYFDCDTGMALAVNGTINRSLTIPANSTAQLRLRLRHDWDWIERRTVTSSIYGVLSDRILDALVHMGLKGSDLKWVVKSARFNDKFKKLFYEKIGVRPRALYRYTLQVEGLDARPHRDVEVVVNEFQQGWFRGSFAAAVYAKISCLFWYNSLVAPGCALAIITAEALYLAAYGEVALLALPANGTNYRELVDPQPLTLSVLDEISAPAQRVYVEQHIQVEALQRAALESLRRASTATAAGDGVWALRQRQHARRLLEQAAAQLGTASRQAATLVAALTPPTAEEIAAYQAALGRDGFDATTRTIFADVGVTAADQEALRADLLTLAPEDWPELSVLPTALSAYERSVAELASTAAPTVFLPLVRR